MKKNVNAGGSTKKRKFSPPQPNKKKNNCPF